MGLTEPLSEGISAGPMVAKLTDPLGVSEELLGRTQTFRDRVQAGGGSIEDGALEGLYDPTLRAIEGFSGVGLSDLVFFGAASAIENNSGSIQTLFDASGNEHDAMQTTTAEQPTLDKSSIGGRRGASGDGTDDTITTGRDISISEPITEIAVGTMPNDGVALMAGTGKNNNFLIFNNERNSEWAIYNGAIRGSGGTSDSNAHVFSAVFKSTDTLRVDKTQMISKDVGSYDASGFRLLSNDEISRHNSGVFLGGLVINREISPQKQDKLASQFMQYYSI
jgi:hypothetical protein